MSDFRKQFQKIIETSHIPSNMDRESKSKAWLDIHKVVQSNIPEKLFRYRGVNNYSIEDFKNGTLSLCHAGMFPDKYDSYLYVNQEKIHQDLENAFKNGLRIVLSHIEQNSPHIQPQKAAQICYYRECGYTNEQIINKIIAEYSGFIDQIKTAVKSQESRFRNPRNSAKIACFTESVHSKYMWDRYADGYKGFALEYDLRSCIFRYDKQALNVCLFPVIYTDMRPDVTLDEGNIYTYESFKQIDNKHPLIDMLISSVSINELHWYKSYLYKDKNEYEHEREWRMLYYNLKNENDYESISDMGCLKAIYYGPDITSENRNILHEIAAQKGLKEYEVDIDTGSCKYDLRVTALSKI